MEKMREISLLLRNDQLGITGWANWLRGRHKILLSLSGHAKWYDLRWGEKVSRKCWLVSSPLFSPSPASLKPLISIFPTILESHYGIITGLLVKVNFAAHFLLIYRHTLASCRFIIAGSIVGIYLSFRSYIFLAAAVSVMPIDRRLWCRSEEDPLFQPPPSSQMPFSIRPIWFSLPKAFKWEKNGISKTLCHSSCYFHEHWWRHNSDGSFFESSLSTLLRVHDTTYTNDANSWCL